MENDFQQGQNSGDNNTQNQQPNGQNGQPNANYQQNAQYGQQNPNYQQNAQYGQPNPNYQQDAQYGQPNPNYQQNAQYGQPNPNYQQNTQYGQPNPNYQYGQQPYQPTVMGASDNTKLFTILSYIGILWLVGLIADKNNPAVKFHVNQGIILSIFEVGISIVFRILWSIIGYSFSYTFFLPGIISLIMGLIQFACWSIIVVLAIIGIVHAAGGRQEPLPIIGRLFTILH